VLSCTDCFCANLESYLETPHWICLLLHLTATEPARRRHRSCREAGKAGNRQHATMLSRYVRREVTQSIGFRHITMLRSLPPSARESASLKQRATGGFQAGFSSNKPPISFPTKLRGYHIIPLQFSAHWSPVLSPGSIHTTQWCPSQKSNPQIPASPPPFLRASSPSSSVRPAASAKRR
jgi:hypothetical protein